MSKKVDVIAQKIFYSQQNPEDLATIIAGLISDEVTFVEISGAKSINIPSADSVTEDYKAVALSQFGDAMSDSVTLSLNDTYTGVSISDGTVTVSSTATDDSFVLKATCGSIEQLLSVTLIPAD